MRTAILSAIVTLVLLVTGVIIWQWAAAPEGQPKFLKRSGDFLDLHIRIPLPWIFSGRQPKANKIIYLNREGVTLRGGGDDATHNRAALAGVQKGDAIHVPAFRGSYSRWQSVVKCLRKAFEPFDVAVVDQRPLDRDYLMVAFGGRPSLLVNRRGKDHLKATGLAPHNGLPIHNAVVLVFTQAMGASARLTCETAAHEIGHAYGLDHGFHCRDFMTYLGYCGTKRFMNKLISCGEKKKRACKDGEATQNSYQELAKVLGLKKR